MTTPAQPPPWPGDDRPMYGLSADQTRELPIPAPPGYGQARERVRPEPQEQYDYHAQQQAQEQYGAYGQPPPARLPAPYQAAGQPQPYYQVAPKNPAVGVIASLFIPGLGSMIAGKGGKGALILILNILGWITAIFIVGWFLALGTWIWGMVAGYQDAQNWNRQHGIIS